MTQGRCAPSRPAQSCSSKPRRCASSRLSSSGSSTIRCSPAQPRSARWPSSRSTLPWNSHRRSLPLPYSEGRRAELDQPARGNRDRPRPVARPTTPFGRPGQGLPCRQRSRSVTDPTRGQPSPRIDFVWTQALDVGDACVSHSVASDHRMVAIDPRVLDRVHGLQLSPLAPKSALVGRSSPFLHN